MTLDEGELQQARDYAARIVWLTIREIEPAPHPTQRHIAVQGCMLHAVQHLLWRCNSDSVTSRSNLFDML